MIKKAEKKVHLANGEVHVVKWLFMNSDFFCGYSHLNDEVSEEIVQKFQKMIDLFIDKQVPPQYILNKAVFFGYDFYVDENCFIPRPETEQLVEEAIYRIDDRFKEKKLLQIADVCCGSGIIGITLKKEIATSVVTLCDISKKACEIAQKNALQNKADVTIFCGDFITPLLERNMKFDVLICNPPYIKNHAILEKMVVEHEPNIALFGGEDGLDFYRRIFKEFHQLILPGGFMGFEFGYDQKAELQQLIHQVLPSNPYEFLKDYNHLDRMLFIYR